jgi:hypothetical protein
VRSAAAVGLAAVALGLAACGGSGAPSAGGGPGRDAGVAPRGGQAMVDAQLAFARCMREQGVEFPDPGSGGFEMEPKPGSEPKLEAAERACAKERKAIADAVPPRSEEEMEADRDATLRFARCMRREGQEVADPGPRGGGTAVTVPPGSKSDPAFQRAQARCEGELRDAAP